MNGGPQRKMIASEVTHRVAMQGSSDTPVIALTFDDGPDPTYTPQVLDILNQTGAKASFTCVGSLVGQHQDLVQRESNDGHMVGNHTWDHADLTTIPEDQVRQELSSTNDAIQQAIGQQPTYVRPPFGNTNGTVQSVADSLGLQVVIWTIDTNDWRLPGVDAIVNAVLSNPQNGAIVLMHDAGGDRSQTVAALPQIITGLQNAGYGLVTLDQVLPGSAGSAPSS